MTTAAVRERYLRALRPSDAPGPVESTVGRKNQSQAFTTPAAQSASELVDGAYEEGRKAPVVHRSRTRKPLDRLADSVETKETVDLDELWAQYKADEDHDVRDQLIVYYAPLVKYVASRVAAGLPQSVEHSDLVSYGMFGLIDAIMKFDLERGFKFETYAISRIKGAILDELRSIDWVPRSVRTKAKQLEKATLKLESELHRSPTEEEIAAEMDITAAQLNGIFKQIASLGLVALDELMSFNSGEGLTFGDTLADQGEGPGSRVEKAETRRLLGEAISTMGEREKLVLTLYYYENMTLAEIGKILGVTESRVCQIHTKSVMVLKSRLNAMQREPV